MNYFQINYNRARCRVDGVVSLATLMVLAACAPLPPKDQAPVLAMPRGADFAQMVRGDWPADRWWEALHDPQLSVLIENGLQHAPSMELAKARIVQANAQSGVVTANSGVNTALDGQVSRQLYTANSIYPPPLGGSYDTSADVRLDLSYDFDFWGRNRAALDATIGQRKAAEADAASAAASLSAAIARTYVQWQSVNARIAILREIESQRDGLIQLETKRVKAGVAAGDNLHPLTVDASAPRQTMVQLETQRDQLLYQIKALVGGDAYLPSLQVSALPTIPGGLPERLDIDLLARRADVAAARDRVQASLSQVDAARAEFYPNVNIAAFVGFDSLSLGKLLQSSSGILGVTPALHLPLFDSGRLRANLDTQRAEVGIAVAQYDQALQNAVSEVNDAAVRAQGVERERAALERQEQARKHELASAQKRLHAGLADKREILRDQLNLLGLRDQELSRQTQATIAHIDLIKALGGGYQDPAQQSAVANSATR